MNNYAESKAKLDAIRNKYTCAGDIIFRTAVQYIVEQGQATLSDEAWREHFMFDIDRRHDAAEKAGKILFCTRQFEKAIFECAFELAEIKTYDLLIYIQREVFLSGDGISYQRAIGLLKSCIEYIADGANPIYIEDYLDSMGFMNDEIRELGYGYLLDEESEDEDDY